MLVTFTFFGSIASQKEFYKIKAKDTTENRDPSGAEANTHTSDA